MNSQELIILTSPPASGKTYWIDSLRMALYPQRILVVSPLRALADECRNKWKDQVDVVTPEEWLGKQTRGEIVIFDEFHLYFYWGDTFRPQMWEVFYELSISAHMTFLLTATLSEEMRTEVALFSSQFDRIQWLDFGNRSLKYKPTQYLKAPHRSWILELLENEKSSGVRLIFCEFRQEVAKLEQDLVQKGFSVVSCVGGEASQMKAKLDKTPFPDFIVSTTVLSHGVNLPKIVKIYFLYQVRNIDFWIQMVARGGRQGDRYDVVALEKPSGIPWSPVLNSLRVLWISFRSQFNFQRLFQDLSF